MSQLIIASVMLGMTQTITEANLNRKVWCAAKNNTNNERKKESCIKKLNKSLNGPFIQAAMKKTEVSLLKKKKSVTIEIYIYLYFSSWLSIYKWISSVNPYYWLSHYNYERFPSGTFRDQIKT